MIDESKRIYYSGLFPTFLLLQNRVCMIGHESILAAKIEQYTLEPVDFYQGDLHLRSMKEEDPPDIFRQR